MRDIVPVRVPTTAEVANGNTMKGKGYGTLDLVVQQKDGKLWPIVLEKVASFRNAGRGLISVTKKATSVGGRNTHGQQRSHARHRQQDRTIPFIGEDGTVGGWHDAEQRSCGEADPRHRQGATYKEAVGDQELERGSMTPTPTPTRARSMVYRYRHYLCLCFVFSGLSEVCKGGVFVSMQSINDVYK